MADGQILTILFDFSYLFLFDETKVFQFAEKEALPIVIRRRFLIYQFLNHQQDLFLCIFSNILKAMFHRK